MLLFFLSFGFVIQVAENIITRLLNRDADVNVLSIEAQSALLLPAAKTGNLDLLQRLLQHKNINIEVRDGH